MKLLNNYISEKLVLNKNIKSPNLLNEILKIINSDEESLLNMDYTHEECEKIKKGFAKWIKDNNISTMDDLDPYFISDYPKALEEAKKNKTWEPCKYDDQEPEYNQKDIILENSNQIWFANKKLAGIIWMGYDNSKHHMYSEGFIFKIK